MQQTFSGQKFTINDFNSLKKGDVYVIADASTGDQLRQFERFARCCKFKKNPHNKAVNSTGKINSLENMRWPLFKELHCSRWEWGSNKTTQKAEDISLKNDYYINNKEKDNMSNCNTVSEALATVQADVKDAAWRTAAHETIKSVRAPLAAFLGKQRFPKGVCGAVMAMSDTDAGEAVLAFLLGTSMRYVPKFCCDAKLTRLAKELRVLGLEHFTTKVADAFLEPLREQLVEVVSLLPFGDDDNGKKK